jgi:hypothetical protein
VKDAAGPPVAPSVPPPSPRPSPSRWTVPPAGGHAVSERKPPGAAAVRPWVSTGAASSGPGAAPRSVVSKNSSSSASKCGRPEGDWCAPWNRYSRLKAAPAEAVVGSGSAS